MIKLPNGCYCSEPSSLTIGENPMLLLKKIGTFSTIFRDDRQYRNGKRCIIKNGIKMSFFIRYKILEQRQEMLRDMLYR